MALSGNKTVAVGASWSLILEWSATQNVSNNTSYIEARLYWQGDYAVYSSASKSVSITIDGATSSSTATAGLNAGQKKLIHSTGKTVSHNGSGDKNVAISGTFNMAVDLNGYKSSSTVSGTWALNSIARKSNFTLDDSYLYYDEPTTINILRQGSTFSHTISYKIGNITRTVATKTLASSTYGFTPRIEDLAAFPNAKYGVATMTLETFDGNTSLGTVSKTFQIHSKLENRPVIDNFSVSDSNTEVEYAVGAGNYVQGFSNLRFTTSASGQYGASIESYSVSFNGFTSSSSSWNHGVINKSGALTATVRVVDSRGYTTTENLTVNVIPYSAPRISTFTATRLTATPTTVKVAYGISISPLLVGGVNKNSPTVQLQYKLRSATSWTIHANYTTTSNSNILTTNKPVASSYDFRILVADKLSSGVVALSSVSTAAVLMDMAQFGIGLGKMWERGALDVRGNSYFDGSTTITGELIATGGGADGFKMKAGTVDHTYLQFYARTLSPNTRSGYFGYPSPGANDLILASETPTGDIRLLNGGNTWSFKDNGQLTRTVYKEGNGYNVATVRAGTSTNSPLLIQDMNSTVSISGSRDRATGTRAISFPVAFDTTPDWVLLTGKDANSAHASFAAYDITSTGCTVWGTKLMSTTTASGTTVQSFTAGFVLVACGRKG